VREVNLAHISPLKSKIRHLLKLEWRHVLISERCLTLPDHSTYGFDADFNFFYNPDDEDSVWKFKDHNDPEGDIEDTIQCIKESEYAFKVSAKKGEDCRLEVSIRPDSNSQQIHRVHHINEDESNSLTALEFISDKVILVAYKESTNYRYMHFIDLQ
jgi:hypothetical protein